MVLPSPESAATPQDSSYVLYLQILRAMTQASIPTPTPTIDFFKEKESDKPLDSEILQPNSGQSKTVLCPHKDRKHYAKGMCSNCYHRQGRTKKAWNCPHTSKAHYSKGKCQTCYLFEYHQDKKVSKLTSKV
eukprot:TRINITY_DN3437_c0_g1_i16.p3 TRINITY_DN3437_c0_g1~~TRINITY_DN3437_c0_g1_i16.p3  ORF type:complete len:132 (-),score=28.78 TRINITY_DN3437_c0_g1_i16:69-464(-)